MVADIYFGRDKPSEMVFISKFDRNITWNRAFIVRTVTFILDILPALKQRGFSGG